MLHCNRLLVFHHRIFSNNDETLANDFNALEVDGDPFFPVMLGFYFDEGAMSTTRSAIIPFIMFILNVTGTCFVPIQDKHDERNNSGSCGAHCTFVEIKTKHNRKQWVTIYFESIEIV